jgi:MraZ protein
VVDPKLPQVDKSPWSPPTPLIQQTGASEAAPVSVPPLPPPLEAERHEPPLATVAGPVQVYEVRRHGETLRDIAKRTLGESERWDEVYKLNPRVAPDTVLTLGTVVRLPVDACIATEDVESVKPLPSLRPDKVQATTKEVVPLTGTFPCMLDQNRHLTLPRSIREQFDWGDTLMISPGTDQCLWLTNQAHLDRLGQKLEKSDARESDVRIFKRLYYAQTEKLTVSSDGRVVIPERFAQFAGLHQEVVLVGIDDHFELWDVARWRRYTQQQGTGSRSVAER